MKKAMEKLESLLELGGTKKDIVFLILSGLALLVSILRLLPLPFDAAWVAIILCGIPIILEAVIGLVTAFDIKADVLVSLALIASVCIGEDFAAITLAIIGTLNPVIGALVHNAGSVLVITNSALLLNWRKKQCRPKLSDSSKAHRLPSGPVRFAVSVPPPACPPHRMRQRVERIRRDLRHACRLSKRPRSPKAAGVPHSYTTAPQPVSRRSCSSASAGMCALSRKGRTYTVSRFTRHTAAHCPPATITGRMMPCKV